MDHARAPSGLSNAASDGHFVVADVAAIKPDFTNPVLYSLETRQDVNMDTLDGSSDDESMPEPSVAGVRVAIAHAKVTANSNAFLRTVLMKMEVFYW